eukprot:GEMP01048803.1.p1 GENE.GEMP01048803.1~~GEMP01048803.1.p1  ORF type:complete len:309 (+),score=44.06 GEMP01048803.1:139-927(+)
MEWRCLHVKDLEDGHLPMKDVAVPGDTLFDTSTKLRQSKSELERCLLRQEELAMSYASVLAMMGDAEATGVKDYLSVPMSLGLSPDLPSTATNADEYLKLVTDFPAVYRIEIEHIFEDEIDEYQDGKDLQRDCLLLNGQLLVGAEQGYAKIVQETQQFSGSERCAKRILQALNRTFSGGTAFDHILRCFGSEFVDITPASADAKPLTVAVTKGLSLGSAHTRYLIFSQSSGEKICEVDAHFTFRMVGENMLTPFLFFEKKNL